MHPKHALVLAPHADDESLGCGGTIQKLISYGWRVGVLLFSTSAFDKCKRRSEECLEALKILGAELMLQLPFSEGSIMIDNEAYGACERLIASFRPILLLAPHAKEQDLDHQAVYKVAMTLFKKSSKAHCLLFYEVWSPLQKVDLLMDITLFKEGKVAEIKAYQSQCALRNYEAILGLNAYRASFFGRGEGWAEAYEWYPKSRSYKTLCWS